MVRMPLAKSKDPLWITPVRLDEEERLLSPLMHGANENFEYIVNPPELPRVAFGSGLERVTLPMNGPCLSSFMRKMQGDVRPFPGPFEYVTTKRLDKKFPSKLGFSALISRTPRLPPHALSIAPPIGTYDVAQKYDMKQAYRPFGSATPLGQKEGFLTPGPPTYSYHAYKPCAGNLCRISTAFGSKRITWPAIAIVCSPFNIAKCNVCGETPHGDYWHNFRQKNDMCRKCMHVKLKVLKHCSTDLMVRLLMQRELKQYKPTRYCGFFHDHNGTTAANQLIPSKTLKFKIAKENYLFGFHEK